MVDRGITQVAKTSHDTCLPHLSQSFSAVVALSKMTFNATMSLPNLHAVLQRADTHPYTATEEETVGSTLIWTCMQHDARAQVPETWCSL